MILTSFVVSPEHLTARRLIALMARASNRSLTLCMLGSFSCFCWCLLAFFKIDFFSVGSDLGLNCLQSLSALDISRRLNIHAQLSIGARV